MARKHSSRHHFQPRDLITTKPTKHQNQKSFFFFFLSKTFGKTFFGKGGGGGANQASQPKIICFFSWKTFGKMFLEILGIAGPEHGMVWPWQTSALPCNPLACLRISLALRCLGIVLAWLLQPTPLPSLSFPWKPLAWPLQPMPLPWLPMACLGIA
jgi:hypothetical protein